MDKIFIDSNIWIYAFISTDDLTKHKICVSLLEVLYQEKIIVVSTQVVGIFHLINVGRQLNSQTKLKS